MISVLETHHVLRGVIDGTKADADEARTIRGATDKTFMVWLVVVRGVMMLYVVRCGWTNLVLVRT